MSYLSQYCRLYLKFRNRRDSLQPEFEADYLGQDLEGRGGIAGSTSELGIKQESKGLETDNTLASTLDLQDEGEIKSELDIKQESRGSDTDNTSILTLDMQEEEEIKSEQTTDEGGLRGPKQEPELA